MSKKQMQEHDNFFNKAKARGANILSFECCCGFTIKTLAPKTEGAPWHSVTFCPDCYKAYFKKVTTTQCEVEEL